MIPAVDNVWNKIAKCRVQKVKVKMRGKNIRPEGIPQFAI
jgi:hypothetical protein